MLTSFYFCLSHSHSMFDPIAAKKSKKKDGGVVKLFQNLIKRPNKSANDSASQSTSAQVSAVSHDSDPGNDAGSAEPTTSSKYIDIDFILV